MPVISSILGLSATSHRYLCSIKLRETQSDRLVIDKALLIEQPDSNFFTQRHSLDGIRSPVNSCPVASDCNVGGQLVEFACYRHRIGTFACIWNQRNSK